MKLRRREIRALRLAAQERKAGDFDPVLFQEPEDSESDAGEPVHTCPGCCKAQSEPFHCTACNAHSEEPGYA